jgi:hypothetical protein
MTEYEFEIDGQKYFGNPVLEVGRLQKELAASQAREAKLRKALQTFIDEHEECTDPDDWTAYMCSCDALHDADNALTRPTDDSALKEALKVEYRRGYDDGFLVGAEKGRNFSEEIKQAKREALMEAADADWWDKDIRAELRRMIGELE